MLEALKAAVFPMKKGPMLLTLIHLTCCVATACGQLGIYSREACIRLTGCCGAVALPVCAVVAFALAGFVGPGSKRLSFLP